MITKIAKLLLYVLSTPSSPAYTKLIPLAFVVRCIRWGKKRRFRQGEKRKTGSGEEWDNNEGGLPVGEKSVCMKKRKRIQKEIVKEREGLSGTTTRRQRTKRKLAIP